MGRLSTAAKRLSFPPGDAVTMLALALLIEELNLLQSNDLSRVSSRCDSKAVRRSGVVTALAHLGQGLGQLLFPAVGFKSSIKASPGFGHSDLLPRVDI